MTNTKLFAFSLVAMCLAADPLHAQINHSLDGQWQQWINKAAAAKWQFTRSCYPHDGVNAPYCTLAMTGTATTGNTTAIREFYDANQVLMLRNICEFVRSMDIRTCWNFDTKVETREMFDTIKRTWETITVIPPRSPEAIY
jgi:hypothetical protein